MVSPDEKIRRKIADAEALQPEIPVTVFAIRQPRVAREVDPDFDRFSQLLNQLRPEKRRTLVGDYLAYVETARTLNAIRRTFPPKNQQGPARERLGKIGLAPPRRWRLCQVCAGSGEGEIGYCRDCCGHGYRIH